jgi:3',5'-cyclic AMP phosphodiesterase CpdA
LLIAQITDLHLGFEPGNADEPNARRLDAVLGALIEGPNRPDLLLVTGDLVDRGDAESYARVADALRRCPFAVYPCPGNHDDRGNFARAFPDVPFVDGFAQYCIAAEGRRLIVLDTLETGRHGGGFCETRARWLAARLDEDRTTPTIIVMHHPPFDAGIAWMSTRPNDPWVERFAATIAGHDRIEAILCGHLHRPVAARWRGITVMGCPSVATPLALDLRTIDPERPDDRTLVVNDPAGFALHRWTGDGLVSHFDAGVRHETVARYDAAMQPFIRMMMAEQAGGGR